MAGNVVYFAVSSGVPHNGAIHISTQKTGQTMNIREDFSNLAQAVDSGTIDNVLGSRLDHPRYYASSGN